MKNLGMLEYFSCAIYALLIIYFLFLSIRVVRDGRRCRDERRNIIMAGIAAVNAIVLIIYDLSLSDSLSGRLVGAVGLALMPVFLYLGLYEVGIGLQRGLRLASYRSLYSPAIVQCRVAHDEDERHEHDYQEIDDEAPG